MTVTHTEVRRGSYHDSVRLMQVSQALAGSPGVSAALVAMATELNLTLAARMGFDLPPEPTPIGPNDMVVAVAAGDDETLAAALARLAAELAPQGGGRGPGNGPGGVTTAPYRTVGSAVRGAGANLALVSTPGRYAVLDALDALDAGASVLVFSDNVPVEQEVLLKDVAAARGLLALGPDCGTAVLGGLGLGFANVVRPGPVGLVSASGTGAQQVMGLLDAAGVGVSHCLGVGGRDLSAAVGGRATLAALDALDADPATELIVLVSKPPAGEVADAVRAHAEGLATPVVLALLGAGRPDLTAVVEGVLGRLGVPVPAPWPAWLPAVPPVPLGAGKALRGLFVGGTLCDEAMLIASAALGPVRSNIPLREEWALPAGLRAEGHVMIDFGDDTLTDGRPHPMIDGTPRLDRLAAEAADPTCGVVLLDVVLGHAAHPDPAGGLAPVIAEATGRGVPVVVSLTGTAGDPQGLDAQAEALRAAGAAVLRSNAAAARYAVRLLTGEPETGQPETDAAGADAAGADAKITDLLASTPEDRGSSGYIGPGYIGPGDAEPGAGPAGSLLAGEPRVVTAGVSLLADALTAQAAVPTVVEWQPPYAGTEEHLARVLADPRRAGANAEAVRRMLAAGATLVDVRPASEVLGLTREQFCHAGPPITWARASGPMRGALVGAVLLEGLCNDSDQAAQLAAAPGWLELMPCHARGGVGPMAGVVSSSMWLWELRDEGHDRTSWCSLNEGLGAVLRYGAYGPEVIDRLRWMSAVLGPALQAAVRAAGPIDIKAIIAQMVQMGDEGHNRNRAGTLMLLRELFPHLVSAGAAAGLSTKDMAEIARFVGGNDHFFLNLAMPAAKLQAEAAAGIPGSSVVTAMARNGTDFGIRVSGTGEEWFTGPAAVPDGLYLGGYGPADANPDIGDSAITETAGLGGFAMAGAPAIVRFVGGTVADALRTTAEMYEITLAENPAYALPALDFRGTPTGIDVTAVLRTGVLPRINTGIAGRFAGTGQVGAGLVSPPAECFTAALAALADTVPAGPTG
ncbi:MAG TPA: DUF1116 domain-containing protein [Mycobacteriales bacterium]|nr:DUF1116 domain-containing protein [Mycobacteriales bacterium]